MAERSNIVAVLDDDLDVLNGIGRLLSAHEYDCELYSSAQAFWAAAAASRASCVVVDIQLGNDSGIALVRRLRQGGSAIPVVFITGSADERLRNEALETGCVGFLQKPFAPAALIAAVSDARRISTNRSL